MKRIMPILVITITLLMVHSDLSAQGVSRSSGIGMRLGFWNITNQPTRVKVSHDGSNVNADIGGVGAWFYFFSRTYQNLFFEFNIGAIGAVTTEVIQHIDSSVEVESIVPLLFGLRYDLLSIRLPGAFQPYLSAGAGPYWATSITNTGPNMTGASSVESSLIYGGYAGVGMNIVLASWFALNFDTRYHFVDFKANQDYSGLEFGLGFSFMWGKKREIFRVKDIKVVVRDIYPTYYQFYGTYPLALVTVQNLAGYPIEVNVRCFIKDYSERPKDSGYIRINRGETRDLPVTAFFGKRLLEVGRRNSAILDIHVEARAGIKHEKSLTAEITVHSRNAWNGDIDKLGYFVTPAEEDILKLTRQAVSEIPAEDRSSTNHFGMARRIFEALTDRGITYHPDPNIPFNKDDRVHFATETLDLGSGDCDDLVVLYASLLESVGIKTAFVEVQDPQKEMAHLYLLFDSGLTIEQDHLITTNEKRYVARKNSNDKQAIWIPVETTLVNRGFEEAWKAAATQFLQDGMLRNGIAEGWMKIIDLD